MKARMGLMCLQMLRLECCLGYGLRRRLVCRVMDSVVVVMEMGMGMGWGLVRRVVVLD